MRTRIFNKNEERYTQEQSCIPEQEPGQEKEKYINAE